MGAFYIVADKWSVSQSGTNILFWKGKQILQSFLIAELATPHNPELSVSIV